MYAKPAQAKAIRDRSERAIARIASRATGDTIMGGASALVMAERACRMGLASGREMREAVSDVYSRSTGRHSHAYGAWQCGECGSVFLGIESANNCCQFDECDDE